VVIFARDSRAGKGLPVGDLFDAAVIPPITILDFAIKANEPRQFKRGPTASSPPAANACHATTDHAFVVIKAPDFGGSLS